MWVDRTKQQQALAAYQADRSIENRNAVALTYHALVAHHAHRLATVLCPRSDLYQSGFIGLLAAIERFGSDKKCLHSTFCTYKIVWAMKDHIRARDPMSRAGRWYINKISEFVNIYYSEHGVDPTAEEISAYVQRPLRTVKGTLQEFVASRELSLDQIVYEQNQDRSRTPSTLGEFEDKNLPALDVELQQDSVFDFLCRGLTARERLIIESRFIDDVPAAQIAKDMGFDDAIIYRAINRFIELAGAKLVGRSLWDLIAA